MDIKDREGILSPSYLGITLPTAFARETLYYIPYYGRFYCNDRYYVNNFMLLNQSFGNYVFFYILDGSLTLESRGHTTKVGAEHLIFLNCEYPHTYYCEEHADFYWFHVNGNNIGRYYDYIYGKYGSDVIKMTPFMDIKQYVEDIFKYLDADNSNEHFQSLQVAQILAQLATGTREAELVTPFDETIAYIRKHFQRELTLDELSSVSGFSKTYFINEFKKAVGSTPHEYLLACRLQEAKKLLRTSSDSMETIAEKCGFNSASHFARAFKKETHMRPLQFRKAKF